MAGAAPVEDNLAIIGADSAPNRAGQVVKTLNGIVPYDWATFLRARLESNGPDAPLGGIERSGCRLVFKDEPSAYSKQIDELNETTELAYSLGIVLGKEARLNEVI